MSILSRSLSLIRQLTSQVTSSSKNRSFSSAAASLIHCPKQRESCNLRTISSRSFHPLFGISNPASGLGQQVNNDRKMSSQFGAMDQPQFSKNFLFRQLFDRTSCTYTYVLADTDTRQAVIIDPVIELAERDAKTIKDLGLNLKYCINTHVHADHITGTGLLKRLLSEMGVKSVISKPSGAQADLYVKHGDVLTFGGHSLEVRETPGHTNGCVTYVCLKESCAFTGDTLLIRGCGRTDFQEGSATTLYDSVWNQILSLPENFKLFPAHDYKGQTVTSVAEEKSLNPRLTKTRQQFIEIMDNLNLSYPAKIDVSLPANKVCGLHELPEELQKLFSSDTSSA